MLKATYLHSAHLCSAHLNSVQLHSAQTTFAQLNLMSYLMTSWNDGVRAVDSSNQVTIVHSSAATTQVYNMDVDAPEWIQHTMMKDIELTYYTAKRYHF